MFRRIVYYSLLATALLFFGAFFVVPVCQILRGGVVDASGEFTWFYLAEVFRNPLYRSGLVNSFLIAAATTLVSMCIALPLAWLSDRYDFTLKRLLGGMLLWPMILAPFVGALGMQCIFGRYGALNALLVHLGIISQGQEPDWFAGGPAAVVVLEALHLFPILYLNLTAALSNVDPTLLEAASDYGCVGFRRFRKITLPLIMPGVFAGGTLVFIWSFTELGTPLMFSFERITAVQIFLGLNDMGRSPIPYALVTVMMLFAGGAYLLAKFLFSRSSYAMSGKAVRVVEPVRLSGWRNAAATGFFALIALFGILPHLGVLGLAFGDSWYRTLLPASASLANLEAALGHNLTIPSILNSLRYAGMALVLAMLIGTFIAWVIVRGKGPGRWLLDGAAMLPLAVPGLVMAFGYLAMTRRGEFFSFLDPVENPTILLVIAYAVRRIPYVVRSAVAGLEQTSVSFEEAAASLGAKPHRTFLRITMPLITANLMAGAILTFSFSMLEVSDSLILAQKAVYFPITKAIYELSSLLGQGAGIAAALGLWTMVFLGVSFLLAAILLGKKLGAVFRG
ncbi:MAG: iron ABC transporter permease [Victivallales bacterium]|nr:iron ABC transporter permease [Victivallales bacterium]